MSLQAVSMLLVKAKQMSPVKPTYYEKIPPFKSTTFAIFLSQLKDWAQLPSVDPRLGESKDGGADRSLADDCLECTVWRISEKKGRNQPQDITIQDIYSYWPELNINLERSPEMKAISQTAVIEAANMASNMANAPFSEQRMLSPGLVSCRCKKGPCNAKAGINCTTGCHAAGQNPLCTRPPSTAPEAPLLPRIDTGQNEKTHAILMESVRTRSCGNHNCPVPPPLPQNMMNVCGSCHVTVYCSKRCQLADWPDHKFQCFYFRKSFQHLQQGSKRMPTQQPQSKFQHYAPQQQMSSKHRIQQPQQNVSSSHYQQPHSQPPSQPHREMHLHQQQHSFPNLAVAAAAAAVAAASAAAGGSTYSNVNPATKPSKKQKTEPRD